MESTFNFNTVLLLVIGFVLTYFMQEIKDAIKGWRDTAAKLDLHIVRQASDKTSLDSEIKHLKDKLSQIQEEAEDLCERVEKLERLRQVQPIN